MIEINEESFIYAVQMGALDADFFPNPIRTCVDDQRSLACDPIVEQLFAQMMGWA